VLGSEACVCGVLGSDAISSALGANNTHVQKPRLKLPCLIPKAYLGTRFFAASLQPPQQI